MSKNTQGGSVRVEAAILAIVSLTFSAWGIWMLARMLV